MNSIEKRLLELSAAWVKKRDEETRLQYRRLHARWMAERRQSA